MRTLSALCALLTIHSTTLFADLIGFSGYQVTVESTIVGSGSQEAVLFADWTIGATPQHAWLVRWDGSLSLENAYLAIEAATSGAFDYEVGFPGQMDFFDGAEQHLGNDVGNISYWNSFEPDLAFGLSRVNSAGLLMHTNPRGADQMFLVDGAWYGVRADTDLTGPDPEGFGSWPGPAPEVLAVSVIPEPSALALVGLGVLALLGRATLRS